MTFLEQRRNSKIIVKLDCIFYIALGELVLVPMDHNQVFV